MSRRALPPLPTAWVSMPTTTTTPSSRSPRTVSMDCSPTRRRLRCRPPLQSAKPAAPAAPMSCSPTTSASRWNARSPRRSIRAITRPASTRPRPAAPSLPLPPPAAAAVAAPPAVGEPRGARGADVMLSYHLGGEVEGKISEAIKPRHYQAGFHSTATCGTFAAAAAAGRLMGLDREALQRALSVAGSQSAGLRENFGTMTKPFHAGRSSESGVVAAQFAAYGWTATDKILEAPRGFFSAAGGGYDVKSIAGKLGAPWTFEQPGVSIKPHPSGSLTHPGMTEMLRLIGEHGIKAADVQHVRVGTN